MSFLMELLFELIFDVFGAVLYDVSTDRSKPLILMILATLAIVIPTLLVFGIVFAIGIYLMINMQYILGVLVMVVMSVVLGLFLRSTRNDYRYFRERRLHEREVLRK